MGLNYTSDFYRINEWYKIWLPDDAVKKGLQDTKTVYDVRIRYANNTNATFSFHGAPGQHIYINKIFYVLFKFELVHTRLQVFRIQIGLVWLS
jgi:hypothetical protein